MKRLLIILLLASCGVDENRPAVSIAPEVAETIQQIQLEAAKRDIVLDLSTISIYMVEDYEKEATAGVCRTQLRHAHHHFASIHTSTESFIYKQIEVERSTWERLPDEKKYNLLIHEIGHCYYGLDHTEDNINFMNAYILRYYDIILFWDLLNDKFFEDIKE